MRAELEKERYNNFELQMRISELEDQVSSHRNTDWGIADYLPVEDEEEINPIGQYGKDTISTYLITNANVGQSEQTSESQSSINKQAIIVKAQQEGILPIPEETMS